MKNNKGFVISTMLYSIFGIMLLIVFYILYILSNNRMILVTSIKEIKNDLETESKEKIYIHFVISDYIKASYNEENLKNIVDNISKETNYIVDYKIENTGINSNELTADEVDEIYDYQRDKNCTEITGNALGDYLLVSHLCSHISNYKCRGTPEARLVNVYNPTDIINLYAGMPDYNLFGYPMEDRYMNFAIDETNNYLYVQHINKRNEGINGIGYVYYYYYVRVKYDPETLTIKDDTKEFGYAKTKESDPSDDDFNDKEDKFNDLYNGYKKAKSRNKHNNLYDYPSTPNNIRDKIPNQYKAYYRYTTDIYGTRNLYYKDTTSQKGIILPYVKDKDTDSYIALMIWYTDAKTEEILVSPNIDVNKLRNYKKKYYILLKDSNPTVDNYQFIIDSDLSPEIEDYTKLIYTDEITKNEIESENKLGNNNISYNIFSSDSLNNIEQNILSSLNP